MLRPNTAVRMQTENGSEQVVNNYGDISFDFGPTLLSWLERQHPATYSSIIAADAESVARFKGHGNAIAQAYNHAILPLCNERDRLTQIAGDWPIFAIASDVNRNQCGFPKPPAMTMCSTR